MADKSNMSVADILAAARKADGDGSSAPPVDDTARAVDESAVNEGSAATEQAEAPVAATDAPPANNPKSGGGRPSVADMLAMARGEKKAAPAADKPKAAPKPAAKATPKKAAPAAKKADPVDTQSILAAARKSKSDRRGPMTKAEAAAKGKPVQPKAKKPKEEIVVPPMPTKPNYAKPKPEKTKGEIAERRAFLFGMSALAVGFLSLAGASFLMTMGAVRFMFPNVLREPPSRFKVGFPDQFSAEQVQTKFKAQFGVWVVNASYNGEQQIVALKSVCTHLGCTPNWLEGEQKFKCPCHGSGFYKDGVNFEGPAPRPLERYAIGLADDGQIEVDKSRIFQEEMGQWTDPACYVPV